jgi:hypothetical protein
MDQRPPTLFPNINAVRSYLRSRGACQGALDAVPVFWRRYRRFVDRIHSGPTQRLNFWPRRARPMTLPATSSGTCRPNCEPVFETKTGGRERLRPPRRAWRKHHAGTE